MRGSVLEELHVRPTSSHHRRQVALSAQAFVSVLTSLAVDTLNARFGAKRMLMLGALTFHLLLAAAG